MTFIGHSLVGASLAQATIPAGASWKQWAFVVNLYVLLAFFPDLPFPGWGHFRYYFSHSLYINLLLIIPTAALCCYYRSHRRVASYPLIAGAVVAWLAAEPEAAELTGQTVMAQREFRHRALTPGPGASPD